MKKYFLGLVVILFVSATSIMNAQEEVKEETKTVTGVYEGVTEDGYKFWVATSGDDSLVFAKASQEVLAAFDLDSEDLVGQKFEITYKTVVDDYEEEEVDEDESEEEDEMSDEKRIHIIIALKKVEE